MSTVLWRKSLPLSHREECCTIFVMLRRVRDDPYFSTVVKVVSPLPRPHAFPLSKLLGLLNTSSLPVRAACRYCFGTTPARPSVSGETSSSLTTSTCPPSCSTCCYTWAARATAAPVRSE